MSLHLPSKRPAIAALQDGCQNADHDHVIDMRPWQPNNILFFHRELGGN
jgi:hypothetical protein